MDLITFCFSLFIDNAESGLGIREYGGSRTKITSKRIIRHIQRTIRTSLRIMHPSLQLHHRLHLPHSLNSNSRRVLRPTRRRRTRPIQPKNAATCQATPLAQRLPMVRSGPCHGPRNHLRHDLLASLLPLLPPWLLRRRALHPYATQHQTEPCSTQLEPDSHVGRLVQRWASPEPVYKIRGD